MSNLNKTLSFLLICFCYNSCSKNNSTIDQTIITTSRYIIEMSNNYTISKYSFYDSNDSYAGDGDAISQYLYYQDSIIIIRDCRSVTARGDYAKTIYYINSNGLADSSLTESDPGHLSKRFIKNFYSYDNSRFLISDSTISKEQNGSFLSSSVLKYEYTDGNMTKLITQYTGSDSYISTYTYNTLENLFSLDGSFKGKPNKNLVKSVSSLQYTSTIEYKLYPSGLVEDATSTSYYNSVKYVNKINYQYIISD